MNCIPFDLGRLNKIIPGIMPGTYYCVTAGTGVGKTQFTKYVFVNKPVEYAQENNVNFKILYFAREESKQDFFDTFRIHILKRKYNVAGFYNAEGEFKPLDLYGLQGFRGPLPDEIKQKLDEIEPEIENIMKYVDVIDTVGNPTGILKYIKNVASERGTHLYIHNTTGEIRKESELPENTFHEESSYRYHMYQPHDPNEIVMIVVDHMSLINAEQGASSLHEAMQRMSSTYLLDVAIKRYRYACVSVHQQTMAGEGIEYYKSGLDRLFPSMDKLGDNKLIGRDYHIVLGLFDPNKHLEMAKKQIGYNLDILGNNYRSLHVLKHRKGKTGSIFPLFFDGGGQRFAELPHVGTPELNKVYAAIAEKRKLNQL